MARNFAIVSQFYLQKLMNSHTTTACTIDPEMARYDGVSLFPKKVALAREMLAKTNLKKLHELLEQQKQVPK